MVGSVLLFLLVLSLLVLVHELGHFVAARRSGVLVEEFGFGIPPRVFGKKIGETLYSVNLLPFGGFVRLHGESAKDEIKIKSRAFLEKSSLTKAKIVIAGVSMNFLLALVAFSLTYSFSGVPRGLEYVKVLEVNEGSPAQEAGLKTGDIIKSVGLNSVSENAEFISLMDENKGKNVPIYVFREGQSEVIEVLVTPRENPPAGEGTLGVVIADSEVYFPPVWQRPFYGIYFGFKEAIFWGGAVILGLTKIVSDLFGGVIPKDVAGPVGLYVITTEVSKVGILPLISWIGIISVNLAIFNILPFPALDGGRLLFIGVEKALGRKIIPKVESWLNMISFGLLIAFLLAVSLREIRLIISFGLSGYIDFLSQEQGF